MSTAPGVPASLTRAYGTQGRRRRLASGEKGPARGRR